MQLILILLIQIKFFTNALTGSTVRPAKDEEFPFAVAIKSVNNKNSSPEADFICTGAMVSHFHVLTNANDLKGRSEKTIEVIYNSTNLHLGLKKDVRWIMFYNEWATGRNLTVEPNIDLAMLRLHNQISSSVRLAHMSPLPRKNLHGLKVVTIGWGKNAQGKIPQMLQVLPLTVLSENECVTKIKKVSGKDASVSGKYICSGGETLTFIRKGDNGGPVIFKGELIAVNSRSSTVNDEDFNSERVNIHITIDEYRNFITHIIQNF